jgi:dipeptidyl aminopeptidase/acylaminoacyl peptidase
MMTTDKKRSRHRAFSVLSPLIWSCSILRSLRSKPTPLRTVINLLVALTLPLLAGEARAIVSVDDLTTITSIASWSVSPNGRRVAFLGVQALPRQDRYQLTLYLQATSGRAEREVLAQYFLRGEELYDATTHVQVKSASQYVWSPDSGQILYTVHRERGMAVRLWDCNKNMRTTLLSGHERIEIEERPTGQPGWRFKTFDAERKQDTEKGFPKDQALLIKDGYSFLNPLENPRKNRPTVMESWRYDWGRSRPGLIANSRVVDYLEYPREAPSPEKSDSQRAADLPWNRQTGDNDVLTEWGPEKTIITIKEGNMTREIYEENALLFVHHAERTDLTRHTYESEDHRLAVLVRSTNLMPDELVKLDLVSGKVTLLFAPNRGFVEKTRRISVRFMPIEAGEGKLYGRLYLPTGSPENKPYPLVFAPYLSTPGFRAGSDDIPILALVSNGIAVFALEAHGAADSGHKGDLRNELTSLNRPLDAMVWVIDKLKEEGVVDPERCGLNGLSYGAAITMYAYWKSTAFRALSTAGASWEELDYFLFGPNLRGLLNDRGLPEPGEGADAIWRSLSAGLNARASLPPLLWQTAEMERNGELETWFRLRSAGAQVEWLEYPDEGHSKRGAANIWWVSQRNLDWFRFWLKGEEDPDPAKGDQYGRWHRMRATWEGAKARDLK